MQKRSLLWGIRYQGEAAAWSSYVRWTPKAEAKLRIKKRTNLPNLPPNYSKLF